MAARRHVEAESLVAPFEIVEIAPAVEPALRLGESREPAALDDLAQERAVERSFLPWV